MRKKEKSTPDISVIVPVFNEEANIKPLFKELRKVMEKMGKDYEIIFIDDGSMDDSLKILKTLRSVRIIVFRKNFGQTAAIAAGMDNAKGKVIVALDADLQNDPKDIPRLISEMRKGYDIVSGWRKDRKDNLLMRRIPSFVANWLISKISGLKLHDYGCTLKVYKKEVVKDIMLYGEMHRFIPAIAASVGYKVGEIEVSHNPRLYGTTKYGIGRTFRVILDLITVKFLLSYQTRPLHLFGGIGFLISGVGSIITVWLVYERITLLKPLSSRPLFMVAIFMILVGIQFITIGLLAEFLTRIYFESQDKPTYAIKEIVLR
jgi:glycosyltransferase involved in cell wall biosynthesis